MNIRRAILTGLIGTVVAACGSHESTLQQYDNPTRHGIDGDMRIQGTVRTYELPPMYTPEGAIPYKDDAAPSEYQPKEKAPAAPTADTTPSN